MKKYLTFKDDKSDKFWSIELKGLSFTVTYGKTGTDGASQTKTFKSDYECLNEAEKLVPRDRGARCESEDLRSRTSRRLAGTSPVVAEPRITASLRRVPWAAARASVG